MTFFVVMGDEIQEFETFDEAARFIEDLGLEVVDVAIYTTAKEETTEMVFIK